MPSKKDRRAIPDWISRPQGFSEVELSDLSQLEDLLDREYSVQDMRRQQKRLLDFLGRPRAVFDEVRVDRGVSPRPRVLRLRPLHAWIENSVQHFPVYVAIHLRMLWTIAHGYAFWGEEFDRPDVAEWAARIWQFLEDYERLLRLKCRESRDGRTARTSKKGTSTFPTPPGARWEDVRIQFKDGHTVAIRIRNESGFYNYTQMGMASDRNANPTVQWGLLGSLAEGSGRIDWSSPAASPRIKSRIHSLAKNLKEFFGIQEYPFETIWKRKPPSEWKCIGWKAKFRILPERADGEP